MSFLWLTSNSAIMLKLLVIFCLFGNSHHISFEERTILTHQTQRSQVVISFDDGVRPSAFDLPHVNQTNDQVGR